METRRNIDWIIEQHHKTNHFYDEYLPYEFHLRMVVEVGRKFKKLVSEDDWDQPVVLALWGHDLIEDTRTSYSDVSNKLGSDTADIIFALTNEKGKTRKERANDKYYEGIRNVKYGVFCKLCDRIANVQYSKMSGSRMFDMYKRENDNFTRSLGWVTGQWVSDEPNELTEMFVYLDGILNDKK